MDAETLRQYLEFYQDLGLKTLYRRTLVAQVSQVDGPGGPSYSMELPPLAPNDDTLPKILEVAPGLHTMRDMPLPGFFGGVR